ncbi:MAG: hypothetical protein ACJAQW_000548 [Paracoccaceae bacterium]|jgi:hypothetical protein
MTTFYPVLRVWFSASNTDATNQERSCAALMLIWLPWLCSPSAPQWSGASCRAVAKATDHTMPTAAPRHRILRTMPQIPAKQASGKQDKQQKAHHEQTDTHPFAPVDPLAKNERTADDTEQNLDLAQRSHIGHRL